MFEAKPSHVMLAISRLSSLPPRGCRSVCSASRRPTNALEREGAVQRQRATGLLLRPVSVPGSSLACPVVET